LAGGRHCAQRGGAACFFLAGIILIGIAFLIGVPFLGGACICVSVVGAIARSGEVLRAFLKMLFWQSPINKSRSFRTDMLR
jgi:hypothetical protein